MPTLIECIADRVGKTVEELVGVAPLQQQLNALESNFDAAQANLATSLANIGVQISALQGAGSGVSPVDIAQLRTDVDNLTTQVAAFGVLPVQITAANALILALQSSVAALGDAVTVVSAAQVADSNNISALLRATRTIRVHDTDTNFTAICDVTAHTTYMKATLTANRTVTLDTASAIQGYEFKFFNQCLTFLWDIGGIISLAQGEGCTVGYDSAWGWVRVA